MGFEARGEMLFPLAGPLFPVRFVTCDNMRMLARGASDLQDFPQKQREFRYALDRGD
jgi:hypothetical protein